MLIEFNDSEFQIMLTAMKSRVKSLLMTKEKNKNKEEESYPYENNKLDERIDKAVNLYNKLNFERMKDVIKKG